MRSCPWIRGLSQAPEVPLTIAPVVQVQRQQFPVIDPIKTMTTDNDADAREESQDSKNDSEDEDNGPNYSTGRLTFEEWNRMATEANPLDSYLKKKKEFEETEPPIEAIKLYREERTYYLLNRGSRAIESLRYRVAHRDVNTKQVQKIVRYEVKDLPSHSYVEIAEMDLDGETRIQVELQRVVWQEGDPVEEPRVLTLYQPTGGGVPPIDQQELETAGVEPVVVESDS
jgi:hypothetical protein